MICLRLSSLRDPSPALTGVMISNLYWLTEEQLERLKPFFPKILDGQQDAQAGLALLMEPFPMEWCQQRAGSTRLAKCGP